MAEHRLTNYITRITSGIRSLHRPGGSGLLWSLSGLMDRVLSDASDAVREGMLLECSDAALDYHARNSNDRRVTAETNATLRSYLSQRWLRKKEAGTEDGLRKQLARLGYPNCELWSYQRLKLAGVPANVAFGGPAQLGFWFVIIRPPHPFNDGPVWDGGADWDDGSYWGGSAAGGLGQRLSELEFTLHAWRASGRSPRFAVIDLDGTTQVQLTPPYDFTGNYEIYPFFEAGERIGGTVTPFYSASFVNP